MLQAFCVAAAQVPAAQAEETQPVTQPAAQIDVQPAVPITAEAPQQLDVPATATTEPAVPVTTEIVDAALQRPGQLEPAEPCSRKTRCVVVAEAFVEMHSGPGRGYPVFHVAERDEQIEVLNRRTDWFYVRTTRQIEGWVSREQLLTTMEVTGEPIEIHEPSRSDYTTRRWEGGAFVGRMETASLLAFFGGYGLSDHLTAELTIAGAVGPVAANYVATLGLNHTFAPEWWASPYVGLGTGIIKISPRATLVQSTDRTDQVGYVALGARAYLSRRFVVRFEYRNNVVFTSRDENEEIHEWKLGFGFFF